MTAVKKKRTIKQTLLETNNKLRRFLLWAFFISLSIIIVMFNFWQAQVEIGIGDVAGEDVFYEGTPASYVSTIKTNEAKTAAAASVKPVYRIDNTSLNSNIALIETYFAAFEEYMLYTHPDLDENAENIKIEDTVKPEENKPPVAGTENTENSVLPAAPSLTYEELLANATYFLGYNALPEADLAVKRTMLEYVMHMSQSEFVSIKKYLQNALTSVIQPGVTEDELVSAVALIESNVKKLSLTEDAIAFLLDIFRYCDIKANKFYDAVSTAAEVDAALEKVQPITVSVMKGEKIISRGSIVDELQLEALKALGLLKQNVRLLPYVGLMTMIVLFYILLIMYVRNYYPKSRVKEGNIVLMGVIINFTLLLAKALSIITIDYPNLSLQLGYLLPIAASSMLVAILIGPGVAIIISFFISVFSGLLLDGGIYCTVVAMVGSVTGVFCSRGINQRGQFVNASLYLACANIIAITALNLLTEQSYRILVAGIGFGFINGLISAVLAMGFLPFLESGFKITTSARLMELANSNHPLLKRLMLEAPGTYHHSVLVGNLAETAADAIGADPLLVRVCAYYHDIGKLKRPYFFIENQQQDDNPHDKLQPSLSALIITSHVKDGVDILKENHFPKEIIDAVQSHHGTSVLSFFYRKALAQAEDTSMVHKDDYCYRGKLPDTKELALVSLADAVQAAVQALNTDDIEAIEQRVRSVVKTRLEEGQLNNAPLTFSDLEQVVSNFVRVLSGMNHSRIEYPEQVARELQEAKDAKAALMEGKTGNEN